MNQATLERPQTTTDVPTLHALAKYAKKHNMPTDRYRERLMNERATLRSLFLSVSEKLPMGAGLVEVTRVYTEVTHSLTLSRLIEANHNLRQLQQRN